MEERGRLFDRILSILSEMDRNGIIAVDKCGIDVTPETFRVLFPGKKPDRTGDSLVYWGRYICISINAAEAAPADSEE